MGDAPSRPLTDAEVAERYHVSTRTVRTWREKGALRTLRTPGGRPRTVPDEAPAPPPPPRKDP